MPDCIQAQTFIIFHLLLVQDWSGQSISSIVSEFCGLLTILSGTVLLHTAREQEIASASASGTWLIFNTLFKPLFHPFLDFSCDFPFSCWSALLVWIKIRGCIVNSLYWVNFMYWTERSAKYLYTHAKRKIWCITLSN